MAGHHYTQHNSTSQEKMSLEQHPSTHPADITLRYIIIVGIFLLPLVSLIVADHLFFPFITGKNFTFRIIVEIITALWLILALRDRTALPKSSKLLLAFAVFIGVIFVSDLLSPNIFKSFWSNYERMEGWVTLAHLFALFLVLCSVMTKKLWEWLFRISIGVSLILFVYGLFQLKGSLQIHQGSTRIDATIGNSAYLGGYMLFHVFLALYLLCVYLKEHYGRGNWNIFWPTVYGIAALADVFVLFKTATRGAEIGLVVGLVCFAAGMAFFEKEHKLLRRAAVGVLVLVFVLGSLFVAGRKSNFVVGSEALSRLGSFTNELLTFDKTVICNGEMKSRCLLWPVAFQGVKERPLFGWGQESFNYVFNKYYDPRLYSQEQWFDRTHNVFLDWLIAGGVLGLLSYLSLFLFALYYLWRKSGRFSVVEKSLLTGLFVGYFIHNLTVFDNITSYIMFTLVLGWVASTVGEVPDNLSKKIITLDSGTKNRVLIPLISVAAVFVLYRVNVPALLAASDLIFALSPNQNGPVQNLAYFKKALSYRSLGDAEINEQLVQKTSQLGGISGADPKLKNDFFDLTKKEMLLQLERTPDDARYYLFMGSFLGNFSDNDGAIYYLEKAHELSPKKQTILFSLGSIYLGKGDYKNGVAVMKQAFDLDPSFSEARIIYAIALLYAKQGDLAAEMLKPLSAEMVLSDQRLIRAYFVGGYFTKALESINFLLGREPSNVQYYFTRAAVLNELGRTSEAVADLNKTVEINPSAKTQADYFIQQIRDGKSF